MSRNREPAGASRTLSRREVLRLGALAYLAGAAGAALPAAASSAAPPAQGALPLRFATIASIFHLINYEFARRQGLFAAAGVDPQMTETNGDITILQGMQSNEFDFTDGGPGTPLVADTRGGAFTLVGTLCSKLYYAAYARGDVRTVADLRGKTLGTAALGSLPHLATISWLRTQGVDPSDVQFIALGPTPEVFRAIVAGKVDGGVAGVDFLPLARRQGIGVLSDYVAGALPGYFMLAYYSRRADLADANRREAQVRFLTAVARASRAIYDPANKEAWVQIGVELQGRDPDDLRFLWDWMREHRLLAANLEFTPEQVQFIQEQQVLTGSQDRVLPFDDVATLDLQREVLNRIGPYQYP
jgi:ABC-type nitrate/sulfonate/bicarbonate transport system substrate-binding protein